MKLPLDNRFFMFRIVVLSVSLFLVLFAAPAKYTSSQSKGDARIVAGPFSSQWPGGPPDGWQRKDIKGMTLYSVVAEKEGSVLRAESKNSASGLFRDIEVDPKQYPIVNWEWRVGRVPSSANEKEKGKDDCAARVFVVFKDQLPRASAYSKLKHKLAATFSSFVPPGVAICYVWSNKLAKEESLESPFTDWVRIVAVESGTEKKDQWVSEQRNVFEDFKRLFGSEPEKIVGVAVMTDTDQTGESITSFYREISFTRK